MADFPPRIEYGFGKGVCLARSPQESPGGSSDELIAEIAQQRLPTIRPLKNFANLPKLGRARSRCTGFEHRPSKMQTLRPINTKKQHKEIRSQYFMSNPFNFNNWLNHDGDGGTATKDDFQIGQNNRIHSPDDSNQNSVTLTGATIVDVRTPQNAALVGKNGCINDVSVGAYGESSGPLPTPGIGVAGTCEAGCGVAGIATKDAVPLPPSQTGVFGAGVNAGVYGASLAPPAMLAQPVLGTGVFGVGDVVGVEGDCNNKTGNGVLGQNFGIGNGVAGTSLGGRGGLFISGVPAKDGSSSTGGIAQLRLMPSAASVFPVNARVGDLYAHVRRDANFALVATLWLCVKEEVSGTKQWSQIVTSNLLFPGGANIP
jgi:hypothetical protein